jgi:hypothetical protein
MSSEHRTDFGEWSHSARKPDGPDFTRVDSAGMRASVSRLETVADMLAAYAKSISDQALVAPGGDPVSVQSVRVLRVVMADQLAAVRAGVAAFRERAEIVRAQVALVERTEYESRARFTEEST